MDATHGARRPVLHVALNPHTGPWSVMKGLALAQRAADPRRLVGLGLLTDSAWSAAGYESELAGLDLPIYRARVPRVFGTAAFLLQLPRRPFIEGWAADLARRAGTEGSGGVTLHSHNAWMTGAFLPWRGENRASVARTIVTFHGINARFEGQPIRHGIHRWLARRLMASDAVFTSVDRHNLGLARDVLGIPPERFTVIPNGVPPPAQRAARPYVGGANRFTLGFVGSLTERKGWRIAAEAVERLAARGRPARLVLAGNGPDEAAVRDEARRAPDRIEYVGWTPDPRGTVMPRLDALAVMSVHEGLPMVIVEAMSLGIPVLATAVGGVPEAVADGETGLLLPRDAAALAEAVERLMTDRPLLARLSEGGVRRFADGFDIRRIVDRYNAVYGEDGLDDA
jgi:glycosyltransferase involved in cell wall biosynthesis